VAQTVVAESAFNDPTGAVLALAIAGALVSGKNSLTGPAGDFVGQLALSSAGGVLAGIVLSAAISSRRTGIWRESAAIAVLAVLAMSYVSLDFAGGSVPGRLPGGPHRRQHEAARAFDARRAQRDLLVTTRSLADIVTIFVFVLVGANLPFHALGEGESSRPAVVAVLLLVARPITVAICCLPDRRSRWSRAELAFVCWTRETGVVPAALVGVLAALAVPTATCSRGVVALAIIVTLAVQAVPPRGWRDGSGCWKWSEPTYHWAEIVG
jgi:cell volume regulation protein A